MTRCVEIRSIYGVAMQSAPSFTKSYASVPGCTCMFMGQVHSLQVHNAIMLLFLAIPGQLMHD